jgi:phosphoenolpyruvate carboxylase
MASLIDGPKSPPQDTVKMTGEDMYGIKVDIDKTGRTAKVAGPLPRERMRQIRATLFRYCRSVEKLTIDQTAEAMCLPRMTAYDLRKVDLELQEVDR